MVKIYVGNTDNDWFDFLAGQSRPRRSELLAADYSELREQSARASAFAFPPEKSRNRIGGFGTLAQVSRLPIEMAWQTFGSKNGVGSLGALVSAIARYRKNEVVTPSDSVHRLPRFGLNRFFCRSYFGSTSAQKLVRQHHEGQDVRRRDRRRPSSLEPD